MSAAELISHLGSSHLPHEDLHDEVVMLVGSYQHFVNGRRSCALVCKLRWLELVRSACFRAFISYT
jgi:hypothetical protein